MSVGKSFAASPITSKLRANARFFVSSRRNASFVIPKSCPRTKSISPRYCAGDNQPASGTYSVSARMRGPTYGLSDSRVTSSTRRPSTPSSRSASSIKLSNVFRSKMNSTRISTSLSVWLRLDRTSQRDPAAPRRARGVPDREIEAAQSLRSSNGLKFPCSPLTKA